MLFSLKVKNENYITAWLWKLDFDYFSFEQCKANEPAHITLYAKNIDQD